METRYGKFSASTDGQSQLIVTISCLRSLPLTPHLVATVCRGFALLLYYSSSETGTIIGKTLQDHDSLITR